MLSLVETDNDRTVDVQLGDLVRVTLPENATTGYRWTVDHCDEELIEALGSEPRYPAKAVGSGGPHLVHVPARLPPPRTTSPRWRDD